jgi:AcrR family transcriptional regulator
MGRREVDLAPRGSRSAKDSKREELIAAAIACFQRYGVQRTRIEDAANAAGISGTNFYNFFPSRAALVDAVVLSRISAIADKAAPAIRRAPNLSVALVEGVVKIVETCRRDELFMELLRATRNNRLGELATDPSAFGYDVLAGLWRPALEAARTNGELRGHLGDDEDTIAWLGRVLVMLLLNERLRPAQMRHIVGAYVAPAIVTS